jgi:hypothetical protein
MRRPVKSHVFRGKRYGIEIVSESSLQDKDGEVCLGKCNPPTLKHKCIKISNTLKGNELLRVLIHEAMHASDYTLPEPLVDSMSRDIATFLIRMNYVQKQETEKYKNTRSSTKK